MNKEIEVKTRSQAERVAAAVRSEGLMAHIENHETYFVVHVAAPEWVRDYYSRGGTWGYGPFPKNA